MDVFNKNSETQDKGLTSVKIHKCVLLITFFYDHFVGLIFLHLSTNSVYLKCCFLLNFGILHLRTEIIYVTLTPIFMQAPDDI